MAPCDFSQAWVLVHLPSPISASRKMEKKEKKNPHKKKSSDAWKAMSCSLECLFCKQTNGNKLCWTFNKMHIILGLYFCQEKKKVRGSRERKMPWSKDHKGGFLLWDTGAFPWPKPDWSKCQIKNHENYKQVTYLNLLPFLFRPQAAARGHPCSCGWPSPEAALRGHDKLVSAEQGRILECLEPAAAFCISPFCVPGAWITKQHISWLSMPYQNWMNTLAVGKLSHASQWIYIILIPGNTGQSTWWAHLKLG